MYCVVLCCAVQQRAADQAREAGWKNLVESGERSTDSPAASAAAVRLSADKEQHLNFKQPAAPAPASDRSSKACPAVFKLAVSALLLSSRALPYSPTHPISRCSPPLSYTESTQHARARFVCLCIRPSRIVSLGRA